MSRPRDTDRAREEMVETQLRARGIRNRRVLDALAAVPREEFVATRDVSFAYSDNALPLDCGQTISQPYMVAVMTEALDPRPGMHVLELGSGSGYQAAVLAEMGAEVYTIERHPHLAEQAAERLERLGYDRVHVRVGDGTRGWPDAAPFDGVMITAASAEIPDAVWEQLVTGGRLVAPLGDPQRQDLHIVTRLADGSRETRLGPPCRFVPLIADSDDDDA